ncbi:MAG: metal-dependent hydrolase [Sphingobacteriales bacterium 46-32]|nr:putative metal-dependent hydrolase [Chitinophagaceae bacterium]OJW35334.1 MAG: metal-dependent hydrolase [Sphingobacteriales bacterium 46-32]
MVDPRYPIGQYEARPFSIETKVEWLADIKFLPIILENAVANLDEAQLHTPYREGGWTVHQLVHHIADSHINAFCRFRLGLTEDNPVIKPYDENGWVQLYDVQKLPVNISITLLHALHARMYEMLKYVTDDEWNNRTLFHPEHKRTMRLWYVLGMYAWHGKHHVAHITTLREQKGW